MEATYVTSVYRCMCIFRRRRWR